jgi:hypothetical protein
MTNNIGPSSKRPSRELDQVQNLQISEFESYFKKRPVPNILGHSLWEPVN